MVINDFDDNYIVFDTKKKEHQTGHPSFLSFWL